MQKLSATACVRSSPQRRKSLLPPVHASRSLSVLPRRLDVCTPSHPRVTRPLRAMDSASDVHIEGYEPLISPALLKSEVILSAASHAAVLRGRQEAAACISGASDRLLVVVGPCSIHSASE